MINQPLLWNVSVRPFVSFRVIRRWTRVRRPSLKMWRRRGPRLPFIPHRFPAGLALSDLALFLTGLWNAADDGSIFQHCFTCSKRNHMPHSTASLLSVIGSTCAAKPPPPRSPNPPPPSHIFHYTSPLLPPGLGCHILVRGQAAGHIAKAFSKELTWLCMSNSVQWDDCIACPTFLGVFLCWNLSGGRECALRKGGLDIEFDMLWEHRRVPDCWLATVWGCLHVTGRGCRARTLTASYITAFLLFFLSLSRPEQDCIRGEYVIFINLISHGNFTCLSLTYGRNYSVISGGVEGTEIELSVFSWTCDLNK